MATDWDPSKVHIALTPKFLTPIADLIWEVQHGVADDMRPTKGDGAWIAGCLSYSRRCDSLAKFALTEAREWLWAGMVESQFTIKILGFPIRIYRRPADGEVPERYAIASESEVLLLGFALGASPDEPVGSLYRIEVQTTSLGRPLTISLVEVDEFGNVRRSFAIPRSNPVAASKRSDVRSIHRRKPAVMPPEPDVKTKKHGNDDAANAEDSA